MNLKNKILQNDYFNKIDNESLLTTIYFINYIIFINYHIIFVKILIQ